MKSILLVDDEANICVELQGMLQGFGYHVEVAHTFESALSWFGKGHFDAIVVEFNLKSEDPAQPRTGNGIRLVRQLRALDISVPILMYTVMEGEFYQTTSLDAGADEFILKTGSFSSFLSRLKVHLCQLAQHSRGRKTRQSTTLSHLRTVRSSVVRLTAFAQTGGRTVALELRTADAVPSFAG
jgi:DNA-binding response OmpR family regulator